MERKKPGVMLGLKIDRNPLPDKDFTKKTRTSSTRRYCGAKLREIKKGGWDTQTAFNFSAFIFSTPDRAQHIATPRASYQTAPRRLVDPRHHHLDNKRYSTRFPAIARDLQFQLRCMAFPTTYFVAQLDVFGYPCTRSFSAIWGLSARNRNNFRPETWFCL